jgi:hypothetical protein
MRFWIARDKNGKIYLYDHMPYKEKIGGIPIKVI